MMAGQGYKNTGTPGGGRGPGSAILMAYENGTNAEKYKEKLKTLKQWP